MRSELRFVLNPLKKRTPLSETSPPTLAESSPQLATPPVVINSSTGGGPPPASPIVANQNPPLAKEEKQPPLVKPVLINFSGWQIFYSYFTLFYIHYFLPFLLLSINQWIHKSFFFIDFEAEADVFADMELKTINEMAELQTILNANHPTSVASNYASHPTSVASNYASHLTSGAASHPTSVASSFAGQSASVASSYASHPTSVASSYASHPTSVTSSYGSHPTSVTSNYTNHPTSVASNYANHPTSLASSYGHMNGHGGSYFPAPSSSVIPTSQYQPSQIYQGQLGYTYLIFSNE